MHPLLKIDGCSCTLCTHYYEGPGLCKPGWLCRLLASLFTYWLRIFSVYFMFIPINTKNVILLILMSKSISCRCFFSVGEFGLLFHFNLEVGKWRPYSGVPNRSAAPSLILEDFSFQHKLIRSNIFIYQVKFFHQHIYLEKHIHKMCIFFS